MRKLPIVAVIGTGISGLVCARTLADHGFPVTVFEKSRGVGGRMATRRAETDLRFDHGAQYFTVHDQKFERYVRSWLEDGAVASWQGRIVAIEHGEVKEENQGVDRYVATPGMNAVCKRLAIGLDVRLNTNVASLEPEQDQWRLYRENGTLLGNCEIAIVAVPAAQAADLLSAVPLLSDQARSAPMCPCWAVMLAFSESLGIPFDGAFIRESPLSWIARNSSKPSRPKQPEAWVIHASPEWSDKNLEKPSEDVEEQLLAEFCCTVGLSPQNAIYRKSHRWRFALPTEPLEEKCLFDRQMRIGVCGDWCGGPRVEGAFLSGLAAADRIVGLLDETAAVTV